jgi:hypothetical protein
MPGAPAAGCRPRGSRHLHKDAPSASHTSARPARHRPAIRPCPRPQPRPVPRIRSMPRACLPARLFGKQRAAPGGAAWRLSRMRAAIFGPTPCSNWMRAEARHTVAQVLRPAQYRQHVLHVRCFEKLQPAELHERNVPARQFDLQPHAVMRSAEQHRLRLQLDAALAPREDLFDHEAGLIGVVAHRHQQRLRAPSLRALHNCLPKPSLARRSPRSRHRAAAASNDSSARA